MRNSGDRSKARLGLVVAAILALSIIAAFCYLKEASLQIITSIVVWWAAASAGIYCMQRGEYEQQAAEATEVISGDKQLEGGGESKAAGSEKTFKPEFSGTIRPVRLLTVLVVIPENFPDLPMPNARFAAEAFRSSNPTMFEALLNTGHFDEIGWGVHRMLGLTDTNFAEMGIEISQFSFEGGNSRFVQARTFHNPGFPKHAVILTSYNSDTSDTVVVESEIRPDVDYGSGFER